MLPRLSLATALAALCGLSAATSPAIPSLKVPACPSKGTIQYNTSVPDKAAFPLTQVDLCYDTSTIKIKFTAYDETNFFFNSSYGTNDPIYEYEVMEAFIYKGTQDPQTYLEFEVAPNNVTWHAFVYNPSKVRAAGAPFGPALIPEGLAPLLKSTTTLDKKKKLWVSDASIPLGFFNVDNGTAKGTEWRMNFFRTVVAKTTFPDQLLGAWNPPDEASFHKTPFFGKITFV